LMVAIRWLRRAIVSPATRRMAFWRTALANNAEFAFMRRGAPRRLRNHAMYRKNVARRAAAASKAARQASAASCALFVGRDTPRRRATREEGQRPAGQERRGAAKQDANGKVVQRHVTRR